MTEIAGCDHPSIRRDVAAMALLFVATACVVVWQSSRLTILWDFSFILENATRMAMGDVPYRDFPFPYAPLTFVVQSIIIRLFGRAAWHHAAYAALAGGAASALTYAIVRCIEPRRAVALVLTAPLIILGIYCIFPHPFYDPDCCLVVLAVVFLLMRNAPFAAGAAAVVAVFVKQNIGLALVIAIVMLAVASRQWRIVAGVLAAAACAVAVVALVFGIGNYVHWTIRFAAERRLMPMRQLLSIYVDSRLCWWLACVLVGWWLARPDRNVWPTRVAQTFLSATLMLLPFAWSLARIFLTDDPLERQINLLRLWPLALICGAIAGVIALVRDRDILPLLLIAAIHGAFLSQITWGSTYGIWPLLVIVAAYVLRRAPAVVAIAVAMTILAGGIPYVIRNERLTYAKLDGAPHRSKLAPLRGMTVAGEWLPDFEELVTWLDRNVPRDDAILFLPGEDPLYFTTGRRPRFPVLMFDHTINPYDAATIARLADERGVRWVIVKQRLQLNGTPMDNLGETLRRTAGGARVAARLHDYIVLERPGHTNAVFSRGTSDEAPGFDRPPAD
jgi:hypothetical protein